MAAEERQVGDLPEECLAHVIALTSPRDACRCAAVSRAFRAAADSDHVWHSFIPEDHRAVLLQALPPETNTTRKKDAYLGLCHRGVPVDGGGLVWLDKASGDAYLGLCDGGVPVDGDDGGCRMWLDKASGAKCYALSARRLSLPWDDGEFSWKWTRNTLSRFAEVADLVDCTCLDIYGRLPAAALTPATAYAAYLVYGTAEGHRGLSYPDQETAVAVGGRVLERHRVCLRPDDAETHKFRGAGLIAESSSGAIDGREEPKRPRRRGDGWWEIDMGRLNTTGAGGELEEEEVVASFEVLGWYPKRGLIVEGIEFRPGIVLAHIDNSISTIIPEA
ncbi:hypothetical protein EJB05_09808, partial [Eragrostis curvula]